ncbi:hypothetical protein HMSSN036_27080 [Paenibacillus macerans]|nr:hypothetical protein HMSSN036_27080 [Paenibacillus macerans]
MLADLKVMDAGAYEVMKAAEAGADIVTILGATDDATIRGAVEEAKKHNTKILVDMINVKDIETGPGNRRIGRGLHLRSYRLRFAGGRPKSV